ncbi:MAG: universal stress protein [Candidatus Melainabacteria bacterium]|nr:universal stress protein [Candidatus Melainabacteria bacterium]
MKILVPVESEKIASAQIDFIINHKWPDDLAFHLIYAIEPIFSGGSDDSDVDLRNQMSVWNKKIGLKVLGDVAHQLRQAFQNADILETVDTDHASEVILDIAEDWKADLIVIGAHGRKPSARVHISSVSNAVLCYADCAVIVVRPAKTIMHVQSSSDVQNSSALL